MNNFMLMINDDTKKLTYWELEAICRDLQAKVSRNIIVQQELIETKNELDEELNRFRLIETFSNQAFLTDSIEDFTELTVESFVQTFEQPHCLFYEYQPDTRELHLINKFGFDDTIIPNKMGFNSEPIVKKDSFLMNQVAAIEQQFVPLGLTDAIVGPFFKANGAFSGLIVSGQLKQDQYYFNPINPKNLPAFTVMAQKVGLLLENFKTNQQLKQEIEERKSIEKTLEKQAAELARSNEDLQQFAYIVSHDLRAPLRNIKSFSQLLKATYKKQLAGDGITFLDFIIKGIGKFDKLINDLLQYSSVTSKPIDFEEIDLEEMVYDLVNNIYLPLSNGEIEFDIHPLPTIQANSLYMERLFQNIIDNATKFKQPNQNTHITIQCKDYHTFVELMIKDNGIGIEKKYADRIFQLFQRLHTDKEYQGTGLGLSICKKIVERHEGKIWLHSEGKNKGTAFFIQLPKKRL